MNSLHVYLELEQNSGISIDKKMSKLLNSSIFNKDDKIQVVKSDKCIIGIVHHGKIKSAGVANLDSNKILASIGSFWMDPDDDHLAMPKELINKIKQFDKLDSKSAYGVFSFAFWDKSKNMLIVDSDLFGVFPLYYFLSNRELIISTQIKSIVEAMSDVALPNYDGVAEYLRMGYLLSDQTLIENIKRIPPGYRLIWKDRELSFEKVLSYHFDRKLPLNKDRKYEIFNALEKSVLRSSSDMDELSVSLSGGLDSRILAALGRRTGMKIRAFCMGEEGSLECKIASKVASDLGITLNIHEIKGEDFPDWAEMAVWLTEGKCPPQHIHYFDGMFKGNFINAVQLHGLLGGPVLGGEYYPYFLEQDNNGSSLKDYYQKILSETMMYWPRDYSMFLNQYIIEKMSSVDIKIIDYFDPIIDDSSFTSALEAFKYYVRASSLLAPCLCGQMTPWVDLILPYIDDKVFNLAASIKISEIEDRKFQYELIYEYLVECAKSPRLKDGVVIPMNEYNRKYYIEGYRRLLRKRKLYYYITRLSKGKINPAYNYSFPFYDRWYRKWPNVRKFVDKKLLSKNSLNRGIWTEKGIKELLAMLSRGFNVWHIVGSMLFIEIFFEQIFDKKVKDNF